LLTGFAAVMLLSGGPAATVPGSPVTGVLAARASWPAALSRPQFAAGPVTINAIAAADGVTLAAGSVNGYPAIWAEQPDGSWSLMPAASSALWTSNGAARLTGLAHGPAGWLAVGETSGGYPLIITSADGVTWRAAGSVPAFYGPGQHAYSAAANSSGYVVVGTQSTGGHTVAAMWWSADLRSWTRAGNGQAAGASPASAAVAAAAIPSGFAAAGTRDGSGAIWTSSFGLLWTVYDVPRPAGTSSTVLLQVAGNGDLVAAAGYATGAAGSLPLVVVSADGGWHWHQVVVATPGGTGKVTTVTAAGGGFIAAGQAGRDGRWQPVTWTSPDGIHWSQAHPAPASTRQITAMTLSGGSVTGAAAAQDGGGPVMLAMPAP
jgi:hypothetical protein